MRPLCRWRASASKSWIYNQKERTLPNGHFGNQEFRKKNAFGLSLPTLWFTSSQGDTVS
uniref:DNA-3-methyladenine glycosylase I n=1 Tax=Arundo donax TaxID=35708 RepID=A0A0A9DUZ8_ARUDO